MAVWVRPTKEDLTAALSATEITAFSRSAGFEDAVDTTLIQAAAAVRGFVRAGGNAVTADAGLVPPSLLPFTMDFVVYRMLKRLNVPVGEDRRKAYSDALDIFKKVAAGQISVEPDNEAVDANSNTLPQFVPAMPERRLV